MAAIEPRGAVTSAPMISRSLRTTGIDLYWLPLGAGGHSVRLNERSSNGSWRGSNTGSAATSTTRRSRFTFPRAGSWSSRRRYGETERTVGSSPKVPSALERSIVSRCFDTRSDAGVRARSPMSTKRSRARSDSATMPPARVACSSWCRRCRHPSGAATSCAQGRCGTRTR